MKTTIHYTTKSANDELTLALKSRKFPWWILLLLLPLILLIPIKRDLLNRLVDSSDIPLAQVGVSFKYNDVGVFGSRTPNTASDITDTEGKCEVIDVCEPLWYYLFVDNDFLYITTENDCPKLTEHAVQYSEYHRGQYKVITVESQQIDAQFTVINKKTGEILPDAKVTVEIILNGQSATQEYTSDANGKVNIPNLSTCAKVKVTGSKEGFIPDSKEMPVADIPQMDDDARTLKLQPDVPLRGKSGALRVNLQWNTKTDLDLVIFDPCGNSISFSNKKGNCNGNIGELDVDANYQGTPIENPQENIFWEKVSPGTYRICVLGWDHKRDSDQNETTDFNISIINGDYREDVQGSFAKAKLLKVNGGTQTWDTEEYLVHEFEVGE